MKTIEKQLPKTIQGYVDFIASKRRACEFIEVISTSPGRNLFWAMLRRGLVRDVMIPYKENEPYTGPRFSQYVLTEEGMRHVSKP